MKNFDGCDIENILETFNEDIISKIDIDNLSKIYKYLIDNGVYFVKDLIVEYLDIFTINYEEFKNKIELLKEKLGQDYIEKIEEDILVLDNYFNT